MRKQLLELQVLQNDTRSKLEEKNRTIDALTVKVGALEDKVKVLSKAPGYARSSSTTSDSQVKYGKKKKKVRRQE